MQKGIFFLFTKVALHKVLWLFQFTKVALAKIAPNWIKYKACLSWKSWNGIKQNIAYYSKHSLLLKTFGLYRGSVSFINIYSGEPLQLKRYNSTIQSKLFSISYQPSLLHKEEAHGIIRGKRFSSPKTSKGESSSGPFYPKLDALTTRLQL